ncbi:MAG TPA: peptidoglycan DD-metalloendopeptidase family protein [Puia sp.]|jgi:septal ring factor EnvC (AmiA/AmiB activator)|nr:peptidoglycan DD-metalloendopeptidase family protein [Puia sp.]
MLKQLLAALLLLAIVIRSEAQPPPVQSKADLEKERAAIQKEIDDVRQSLDETHKNKRQTLGQLALLQRRLRLRESAIRNINAQIDVIQGDMNESWREIVKYKAELDTLKIQYSQSIVFAYKNRSSYDFLNFIFSANSFNDAVRRIEYLKSYRAYREERAENIRNTQQLLQAKIDGLKQTRAEKDDALKKQSRERSLLEDEKKEKDLAVQQLQSHEKELRKEMAVKQKQDAKLEAAIQAAVRRAIREASKKNEEAGKAAAAAAAANPAAKTPPPAGSNEPAAPATLNTVKSGGKSVFTTDEDMHLSGDFIKNKHRMPWPVSGVISMGFGKHELIPGVYHFNIGVTIDTHSGAAVKAVFDGVVESIFNVSEGEVVMVRHGKYFTTYSNLSTVSVTKGEKVHMGQIVGQVDTKGQLDFIVSDEKGINYDPEQWLRR